MKLSKNQIIGLSLVVTLAATLAIDKLSEVYNAKLWDARYNAARKDVFQRLNDIRDNPFLTLEDLEAQCQTELAFLNAIPQPTTQGATNV